MTCISGTSQRVHQSAVLDNKKVSLAQENRCDQPEAVLVLKEGARF